MADVFVVFGSQSDENVYKPLVEKLKKAGVSCELKVLSAHKTPRDLDEAISNTNAEIFVAGAGLSAALPGVVASKKLKPVIGIPCEGAFGGIDSFLATAQMPPGVPVIAVGMGRIDNVVKLCGHFLHGFSGIALVKKTSGEEKKLFEKSRAFLEESKIPFSVVNNSRKPDYSKVFIEFMKLGKKIRDLPNTAIVVQAKEKSEKKDALKFFDSVQESYSVGLNNYRNACLAAIQLTNLHGQHHNLLAETRQKDAEKVLQSNKQAS